MANLDCFPALVPVKGRLQAPTVSHAPSDANMRLQPLAQHEAPLRAPSPVARVPHQKGSGSSRAALASSSAFPLSGPGHRGLCERGSRLFRPTHCLMHEDATLSTAVDGHHDATGEVARGPGEGASAGAGTAPPRAPGGEEQTAAPDVDYLSLTDAELLRQCNVDTYRASGPGGQHRNKTESAVRLRHTPTGCVSQSAEQRSQHLNRDTALLRLRQAIALKVRRPVDLATYQASVAVLRVLPPSAAKQRLPRGVQSVGPKHPDFHAGVRELLDVLAATSCSISEAAAILGVSTAALSKLITAEKALLQQVNDMRASQGLRPLR